ncbi:MAG: hypothetical protein IJ391_02440 [Clostridia bacterium]|nr:hypothetical protein [Clostridia bacterium]
MCKKRRKNKEERYDYDPGFERLKNADPDSSEAIAEVFLLKKFRGLDVKSREFQWRFRGIIAGFAMHFCENDTDLTLKSILEFCAKIELELSCCENGEQLLSVDDFWGEDMDKVRKDEPLVELSYRLVDLFKLDIENRFWGWDRLH